MIETNVTRQSMPCFRILTDDQAHELGTAAMDLVATVGCRIVHPEARSMLAAAGAQVSGEIVKVPRFITQQCLATPPRGWTIYDRQGRRALAVEGRKSYFGTSTASPNTKDALTGEYHKTRVEDLRRAARIADALEHIDWVMPMGSAQDVPPLAADLHEFTATVSNTTKPMVFLTYSPRGAEIVYDMAALIAGGEDALRARPFLILYPESIPPFVFPADVVDRILVAARRGMPQMMGPTPSPGSTAPVTMAGAVAQGVAEAMMAIVIAQVARPGCPVGMGCGFPILDMTQGLTTVGAPEMSLAHIAQAEVAQLYGLPTWGTAGATDAKVLDAQAGAEAALQILSQGQAGLNLIHDVGYMDMAMACSVEQLVLGNEIIGMTKRLLTGIEVSAETIVRDLIAAVGPGGEFISSEHTARHFRKELWRPRVFTRQHHDTWRAEGSKDTAARVREEIRRILDTHRPEPLPDGVTGEMERMLAARHAELDRT